MPRRKIRARRRPCLVRWSARPDAMWPLVVLASTHILYFAFGWQWFRRQLFKDYEVKNTLVRALFSATFALSCSMLQLFVFEIADTLDRDTRRTSWRFDLSAMVSILVFLLPFYSIYTYLRERNWRRDRALQVAAFALVPLLYSFWRIGLMFPVVKGGLANLSTLGR